MQKFTYTALDTEGRPIANALVRVYVGGTNNLATLFQDNESTGKTNPLLSNGNGFVEAKIPAGTYDIETTARGVTVRVNGFEVYNANTTGFMPTGGIAPFAGTAAPSGWLLCNGQAVSRVTFAALFAVIGTSYGVGDNSTTFNVPNVGDRLLMGAGTFGLGATGGNATISFNTGGTTLTVNQIPSHVHGERIGATASVRAGASGASVAGDVPSVSTSTTTNQNTTDAQGGGQPHDHPVANLNILPPYLVTNWIIKT